MLLKLLMPFHSRAFQEGRILKWHKSEGDPIDYGDDLFDLEVEELRHMRTWQSGKKQVERLTSPEALARLLRAEEMLRQQVGPPEAAYEMIEAHCVMRVTSSDTGILRRVCAKEGERRRVGDLLALVATEDEDLPPGEDQALAECPAFRVVATFLTPS